MGGQSQLLLTDNFTTATSKTMSCFIWNKQPSQFSKLRVFVPNIKHKLEPSTRPSCNHVTESFFCTYLHLFLKASDLISAEQLVLALEFSLLCVCNSRQVLRVCIYFPQYKLLTLKLYILPSYKSLINQIQDLNLMTALQATLPQKLDKTFSPE